MPSTPLTIWCNANFPEPAMAELRRKTDGHQLLFPENRSRSNLVGGGVDPQLAVADLAFGQPDPDQAMALPKLRWVHLTTAGYTRYDRDDLRAVFKARGAALTNSSWVYAEPCAQHALAMMLGLARRLPQSLDDQRRDRSWHALDHRARCHLLTGQTIVMLGFGAIARRLIELLGPFGMNVIAVRRQATGNEPCRIVPTEKVEEVLPLADHVMNILPLSPTTEKFMNKSRFDRMKPGAIYYNIGRGNTNDQDSLLAALTGSRLAAAYIDVTDPEPLPPAHPLWTAANCYITPHTAGGHSTEFLRQVEHFSDNLERFIAGKELKDKIV